MASSTLPASSSGGASTSMWAGQSSPAPPASNRGGWGSQGSAFRGLAKGRGGARGAPRGGGRGGRGASNPRGGVPTRIEVAEVTQAKLTEQPKEKSKDRVVKAPVSLASRPGATATGKPAAPAVSVSAVVSSNSTMKVSTKPKPISRKVSEQKTSRTKTPSVTEPLVVPITHSPALSTASTTASRSSGRRRRSNAKPSGTSSRKASVSIEPSSRFVKIDQPFPVAKDMPPHLAAVPDTPSFDIKHSVDALVERVRAVAMDRPNTPGSHIDWAGDDDDSLPDLDDWGVTSSTAGTTDHPDSADTSRIISPILEDTLKPLPSLVDFGPNESTTGDDHADEADPPTQANVEGPQTLESAAEAELSEISDPTMASNDASASTLPHKLTLNAPLHPSLPLKPAGTFEFTSRYNTSRPEVQEKGVEVHPSSHVLPRIILDELNVSSNDSSPERSMASSMHAITTSHSAPSDITTHTIPVAPQRNHFSPTHNRAHTIGARMSGHRHDHISSDGERPRRGDQLHHARTQSTPPSGPGTHGRVPHATRPVITVDAISKLARTLGQTPLRRDATAQD